MGHSLQLQLLRRSEANEGITRQSLTCGICTEPLPEDKVFINKKRCMHPFCFHCIAKYIEAKVENNIGDIPCPFFNCKKLLDPLICRSIISKQVFDKWCDTLCTSMVLKFQHRCYCPNKRCSGLVINECKGEVKKVKCPYCKHEFCFKCQIPWHVGYRCEESVQVRDKNDVLFGQMKERHKWCICYNCGHCIEHVGGCLSIHCRCGATTCYRCGKKFELPRRCQCVKMKF